MLPGKRTDPATKKPMRDEQVLSSNNKSNTADTNQPVETKQASLVYKNGINGIIQTGTLTTDTSSETMSRQTSRTVKSVAEAKANGYTVGVINTYSAANNTKGSAKLGAPGNYANVYKKETDVVQEERTVDRSNISNMNFHIYQNVNSYRKERTIAPVEGSRDSRNRSDSSGNGDYVVYNVQNGAIHHGHGSMRDGLSLNNQNGSNTQRRHYRSRTADMIEAKSSTESLDKLKNEVTKEVKNGKHTRSKSADPYDKPAKKTSKKSEKETGETKEKTKSTSRLLFMRNKLKQSQKKKDSSDKKEEKDKGSKSKSKKIESDKYISQTERKCDRGQELLDMQLPRRDYEDNDLMDSRGSRNSSIGRDDDVFTQNCDVHLNGPQVPRPLQHSVVTSGYSMSYDQITNSVPPGKPPRSNLVSRSHDQLPQKPYIQAPNLSLFNVTHEPGTPTHQAQVPAQEQEVYARKTRLSRPRAARSQTITLDSRDIPYHKCFNESAHALALSGCNTVVSKESYGTGHGYGYNKNRSNGYHSDTFSDDNSSIHSNHNYSDPYSNSSDSGVKMGQSYNNKFQDAYGAYPQMKTDQPRYADLFLYDGLPTYASNGNYADVYQGDQGDQGVTKRVAFQGVGGQLEQIPELNENTGTLKRTVGRERGKNLFPSSPVLRFP